ncbi:T9SS type A sorting domain-containing protein [Chryseolinea sp. H1M3-3]|uniref:T9SS type A sorting domain-containing protein n=1 Tax=Chryseolinea sp. H1M3-3 TaxID=3034144 RepID=UPI0023EDA1CE|nr:T9SS type A sorting domain-containing protein [Chryseolinea sp. H1M3-3]
MNTKSTLLTLLAIFCVCFNSEICFAQVCSGDVILSSQAEVDAFSCTEVTGSLTISGSDIQTLDALSGLRRVGRLFIRENPALTNIDGLSDLEETTLHVIAIPEGKNSIEITDNQLLTNLDGLSSLRAAGGAILIKNNPILQTVNGFSSLTRISEALTISYNDQLQSIDGFAQVEFIFSNAFAALQIDHNPSLKNIDGLASITSVHGKGSDVIITDNTVLADIDGLSSLNFLNNFGGFLIISSNPSLKNIDGLSSLTGLYQGGSLQNLVIENNASLENLDGLANLKGLFGGGPSYQGLKLNVSQNSSLAKCGGLFPLFASIGEDILNQLVSLGNFKVEANKGGCSVADIISSGPPSVTAFGILSGKTGTTEPIFGDSVAIDLVNPNFSDLLLQAHTFPKHVGSVEFIVDNHIRHVENLYPYDFDTPILAPGIHTITAVVYSKPNKQGLKGVEKTIKVNIINSAAVVYFDVVDTKGNILMQLTEGSKINIKDPAFKSINIVAYTYLPTVSNVKFYLNNQFFRVENVPPYALNGDINGAYNAWVVKPGNYTVRAVPYMKVGRNEYAGRSHEVRFKVVSESLIAAESFDIVNTSGKFIRRLNDGDIIDILDPVYHGTTIVANVKGNPGSVRFDLNNHFFNMQNAFPYTLTGDNYGTYFNPWLPKVGHYTVTARPYARPNGGGEAGKPLTIHFRVINKNKDSNSRLTAFEEEINHGKNTRDLVLYPVPVETELYLKATYEVDNNAIVSITDAHGLSVYRGSYASSRIISTHDLKPGVYLLQTVESNGTRSSMKFIKK